MTDLPERIIATGARYASAEFYVACRREMIRGAVRSPSWAIPAIDAARPPRRQFLENSILNLD